MIEKFSFPSMDKQDASFLALFRCQNEEIRPNLFRRSKIRFLTAEMVRALNHINKPTVNPKQSKSTPKQ